MTNRRSTKTIRELGYRDIQYVGPLTSGAHNAEPGDVVECDTTGAVVTVNLPASPEVGDWVRVKRTNLGSNLNVNGNGNDVELIAGPGTYGASTVLTGQGQQRLYIFNGTRWPSFY